MYITAARIFNFGKLQNKNIQFTPGINVIYGKNESGKSTLHEFIAAMLFGMEKGRGRMSAADSYGRYEPWHAPSYYAGALKFNVGGQSFYLERNFYTKEKSAFLRNELDGEELSVAYGDLEMLLGGVKKAAYLNTYDIPQTGAATGPEMVQLISEYLAKATDGTDGNVSAAEAVKALAERKKELLSEQKKYRQEKEEKLSRLFTERELLAKEYEQQKASMERFAAEQSRLWNRCQQEENERRERTDKEERADSGKKSRMRPYFALGGGITALVFLFFLRAYMPEQIFYLSGGFLAGLAILGFFFLRKKDKKNTGISGEKRERFPEEHTDTEVREYAERMLLSMRENLQEKENRMFNMNEELTRRNMPDESERERIEDIQALELAEKEIETLSRAFYEEKQDGLNAEISRLVSLFTNGVYDSVRLDVSGKLFVCAQGREVQPQSLSRGTLEQIYFALRIAAGNAVMQEEGLPILLDEAFAMYDEDRLSQTLRVLAGLDNQVFLFTCRHSEEELLKKNGIAYHLITL